MIWVDAIKGCRELSGGLLWQDCHVKAKEGILFYVEIIREVRIYMLELKI